MPQLPDLSVYKLRIATWGVVNDNGRRVMIEIPAEALVKVTSKNGADGTVNVIWNDRRISMFVIDLQQRGDPVKRVARKARTSELPRSKSPPASIP